MDTLSFYRLLLQNDPNPLLYLNSNLGPEFANDKAQEIFRIGAHDTDSILISQIRRQWKTDLSDFTITLDALGGEKTFRVKIKKLTDGDKEIGYLIGFSDITDHIKDQQSLISSQKNYGNIFLSGFLRMMIIDPQTFVIKEMNKTALDFYGYNSTEIVGKNFISINTTESEFVVSEIHKAKQNKKGRFFSRHLLANGSSVDVELIVGPLSFMENANLYVIINPAIDNSFQTSTNKQDLQDRLTSLIDSINEPVLIQNVSHDPSHERFVLVNNRASTFFGYSKSELLQMTPMDLVNNDNGKRNMDSFFQKILDRKKLQFEIDLTDKNQHKISVEFNSCVNENGLQKQLISVVRDISNQKKMDEVKDEFVNTITHELRTPIAALKGSLYLLKEKSDSTLSEIIEIADRNVERLLNLVNDILDYQKLSMDRLSFHLIEQQINDLIVLIGKEIKIQLDQKGIGLSVKLDTTIEPIYFDRNRITQVLMNITQNAIKFTQKGSVTLITSQDKENVIVSVRDTGIGIKPEDIKKLFLPFAQLTDGVDKKGSSGLGLAISKKMMNSLGGTIWVESEYGVGSTFSVSIPKKSFFKAYRKS